MLDILASIWHGFFWNYFNCSSWGSDAIFALGWIGFGLMAIAGTILHYYTKIAYGTKYPPEEDTKAIKMLSFGLSLLFPGLYGLFLDIAEYIIGGKLYWIFYEPRLRFLYPAITSPIIFAIILFLKWLLKKIRLFLGLEKKYKY